MTRTRQSGAGLGILGVWGLKLGWCLVIFLLGGGWVRAERFFVNWGGDYLGMEASGKVLNLGVETILADASGEVTGVGFALDDAIPKSPSDPSYDTQKPSAEFFGVLQVMNPEVPDNGDAVQRLRSLSQVKALARKNAIGFGSTLTGDAESTEIMGLIYWRKEDFLHMATETVGWSNVLGMNMSILGVTGRGGEGSVRFAVRNGDRWYLSEGETQKGGLFFLETSSWGEWVGLGAEFPLPALPTEYSTSSDQFDDITAFGVFFQARCFETGMNAVFTLNGFQVDAQP